jgi:hypothetical protein
MMMESLLAARLEGIPKQYYPHPLAPFVWGHIASNHKSSLKLFETANM